MEEIVQKVLEIEEKAQQVIINTQKDKQNIEEALKQELEIIKQHILSKAQQKAEAMINQEKAEGIRTVKKIQHQTHKKLEALSEKALQKQARWEEEIMRAIIRR